ncbi:Serine/threonine-protein phosphatase 7 long form-like [Vitis vinifera]|uniref:Serine/threonine-protein phosphatase 7 long form-like n=1 Tax=Vitis vinifera TaxID=29760 RepID=A0A438KRA9_VITVI|nr:Serine/threonine-protein phosphatase 7 long form-like [Vitis vinifera]
MEHREGRFDPDPLDRSILALQDRHRSQLVDSGQLNQVLTCRQRLWTFMREWEMDPRIRRYVMQSGFYGVYRVGHISLDWPLITSLVERWRPETHTFHLPIGEMTVTLQDVAMILGLRIHGPPITGTCDIDWSLLCSELLGVVPPPSQIRGSSISARWLREQFSYPPAGVDDVILQRYARAFILALLGGALFADKTGTHVQLCYLPLLRDFTEISHYSWGSAVLAYLYRELCRASLDSATEISGPITLLQLWSWERLHVGRPDFGRPPVPIVVPHVHDDVVDGLHDHLLPDEALPIDPLGHRWRVPLSWSHNPSPHVLTFYRDQLDAQTQDQVLWEPYTADLIAHLPAICQADEEIWRTMSPLICFDIIEWHRPERVLRQFRMQQGIPPPCLIDMELHLVDRRGRHQYDWVTFHAQYISLWATRSERIATAPLAITTMSFYDPYMQWYRRITRRLIAPVLHRDHMRFHSTASATELLITAVSQMAISNDLEETHRIAIDVLRAIGEDHRVHSTHEPSTSSGSSMRPPSLITPVRVPPIRGRGRGGRRAGHRHVPLASTLVQPSHPPVTSTFPLFQPSASLESPLSPPDVSIPAYSPRPETTIPSTLTPVQPSISLDAPPPIAESIAPPPVTESIAPPPVTESIAPLPFLQGQLMLHDYMYGYLEDIELHVYVEFYLHQFHLSRQLM